jgi:hypothetical protein
LPARLSHPAQIGKNSILRATVFGYYRFSVKSALEQIERIFVKKKVNQAYGVLSGCGEIKNFARVAVHSAA